MSDCMMILILAVAVTLCLGDERDGGCRSRQNRCGSDCGTSTCGRR